MVKLDASRFHSLTRSKAPDDADRHNTFDTSLERGECGAQVSDAEFAQVARIAAHGLIRPITRGEVLIEGAQTDVPFFVVKASRKPSICLMSDRNGSHR